MKQLTFAARSTPLTALAVLLLISGSLVGCSSEEQDAASGQATSAPTAQACEQSTATIETEYIYAEFAAYVLSAEELVKNVDDVFVGRILSVGEAFSLDDGSSLIWTPFAVHVERRLLGTVEGRVTVVQHGGCDPDRNVLVVVKEDPLLEVGETYMFATRTGRNSDRPEWDGQHVVQALKGRVCIKDETHRQQLIQEYTEAINQAGLGS
jgi:hypothetical protein